jgi:hypothetical protein
MKFTLEIELGNDAMSTDEDVARALHRLGSWFEENSTMFEQRTGWVMDANGNDVGRWRVDEPEADRLGRMVDPAGRAQAIREAWQQYPEATDTGVEE